jgi:PAS domain S-box-containing protein
VREHLAAVVESSDDAIISKTLNGMVTAWNSGAERLFGYSSAESVGKPMDRLLPLERATEESDILARIARGERVDHFETVRVRKDGKRVDISATISPVKDSSGAIVGVAKIARDITQRKTSEVEILKLNDELEEKVKLRTAQLEAANKELETFSYSVSHDLRAPLRHISGFSQLLVEEFGANLAPGARHYLDRIQAGTQNMGVLVDELLHLARVGRHALNRRTTNLKELVAEVITLLLPESEGRQVEWAISDLSTAQCDPVLVRQIFQNLLSNALKFTRPRAQAVIEVSCREEDGQPVFMVRDNGIGFNMKYVDKLFGVFQRLHRAEDFEGTGIGLATVQRIVHKHGGQVWAEGELDKGAAFYFTLGLGKQAKSKNNRATAGGRL